MYVMVVSNQKVIVHAKNDNKWYDLPGGDEEKEHFISFNKL